MLKWFKINGRNFLANFINVQYTIPIKSEYLRSCDITLEVQISNLSDYDYIMNLYDTMHLNQLGKFSLTCSRFSAGDCLIKSVTNGIDKKTLFIQITSEFIKTKEIEGRRDEIIESILKQNI